MSIIQLENVSMKYKNNLLFENVNLNINKGKIYGITGPNGTGKSVLFKIICGFIFPTTGIVKIDAQHIGNEKRRFPDNFGVIIDRPGFISNKTGYENLKDLALIRNKIDDDSIYDSMELVGLDPNASQKVKDYSLGMKQKLAIAQAIMENQDVLILDEPFNALDADSVEKIRELLLNFKNRGKTILITSHNQSDIDYLCDEVYRINNCKLEYIK
ncbi:ATP-binding cassette domain-containing protein [Lysinibacillus sphaericus]|uniref:ABC transporter ATP-binding protein n=1 Tax=Lysinibacillus sphaericus TaxID=1421 RepID=UPI0038240B09